MRYTTNDINNLMVKHLFFDEYSEKLKPDFTGPSEEAFEELAVKLHQYGYQIIATELPHDKLYVTLKSTIPPEDEGKTFRSIRGHIVGKNDIGFGACVAFLKTMGIIL